MQKLLTTRPLSSNYQTDDSLCPSDRRYRRFVRSRETISNSGGSNAHILALAYVTDTWFIGTLWRVYNLSPYPSPPRTDHEEPDKDEEIELMASLNHSIYLHHPQAVRVDDWMLTEMESPWAGNERGLVVQRIWSRDGVLIATCIQEVSQGPPLQPLESANSIDKLHRLWCD
jgi:acyl-CoA thioesterase 8